MKVFAGGLGSLALAFDNNPRTMSIPGYKRLTIALGIVCAGLLVLSGCLFWSYGWLKIRVAFASEQTQIFDDMRAKAIQSDASDAARCLEYVVWYYPSGSKQEIEAQLRTSVEAFFDLYPEI